MKLIRMTFLFALLLLGVGSWHANAAEPSERASKEKPVRKRSPIIQISNAETSTSAPQKDLPAVEPEAAPAADPMLQDPGKVPTKMWTLLELEALANSIHPLLQRDLSRIDASRGDALQAGLYPNPRFDSNNPQVFTGQNSLFNAGVMQEFVVKGKKRLDRAAAVKTVQQNEFAFVQDRFSLLTALRQEYYMVLAAQRRFRVLQKLQEITASSLEAGRELEKDAGEFAHIDVLVLEVDNQTVQADLENSIRLLRGARNQLAAIVGDPSISSDSFQGSIYASPPQYDEKILNQFASLDSAYVQIAKLDIERNEILLRRAIAEPYPNLTLGPAYQWGLTNGSDQFWMTVTFPIPAWDRNQGNISSQRGDLAASRKNLEAVQLEQLRRVADSFSRHRAVRAQAAKYEKEIIPNTIEILKLAKRGFSKGEYDFSRFLQVQRTVVEANMKYIDLLEDVWTTAAELSGLLQLEEFQ